MEVNIWTDNKNNQKAKVRRLLQKQTWTKTKQKLPFTNTQILYPDVRSKEIVERDRETKTMANWLLKTCWPLHADIWSFFNCCRLSLHYNMDFSILSVILNSKMFVGRYNQCTQFCVRVNFNPASYSVPRHTQVNLHAFITIPGMMRYHLVFLSVR